MGLTPPSLVLWLAACTSCGPPPSSSTGSAPAEETPTPEDGVRVVPSEGLQADLARTQAFLDTRPTVERPLRVTGLQPVEGVPSLSATTCGACHVEIAAEWTVSVHAQAWIDPQYQAEIDKSGNRWLCLNCHTPLLTQQDRWPVGLQDDDVERPILVDNPSYDAALRDEGITCAACHVRDGVIRGPGLADSTAPHPVETDPRLRSAEVCLDCHQAEMRYAGKTFVCTFQTGQEWADGPYAEEGRTCVDCHMPAVERPAATGGPVRTVRRHWWRGAGIPKIAGRYPPPEANPPGLALEARIESGRVWLDLTNANAGHHLPSGDPERWVQIDATFVDADGAEVGAAFQHRIGQVWRWETDPTKVSDNRLAPRESRTLPVDVPADAVEVRITASSHRISEENAAYHDLGDYPRAVVTHELSLAIP